MDDEDDGADATGKPGADQPAAGQEAARASLGLTLQPLTPATARRLQIQDPSVSMVPRVAAVGAAIVLFAPSIGAQLVVFANRIWPLIAHVGTTS